MTPIRHTNPEEGGKEHRTVTRIMTILELVAAAAPGGLRLAQLAEAIDAPKSSVHGLVQGLVAAGYLRSDRGTYRIGPAPAALLAPALPRVTEVASASLRELRDTFDETAVLSQLIGNSVVPIVMVPAHQPIHYATPMGLRRDLYPLSAGKVFLAAMSRRRLDGYIAATFPKAADARRVREDLARVRERGYSINVDETLPGLSGVGAGIVVEGAVRWAVSLVGPTERFTPHIPECGPAVKAAAAAVSSHLAGERPSRRTT